MAHLSFLDMLRSQPQRFGVDRVWVSDYGQTIRLSAYGQTASIARRAIQSAGHRRRAVRDAVRAMQQLALEQAKANAQLGSGVCGDSRLQGNEEALLGNPDGSVDLYYGGQRVLAGALGQSYGSAKTVKKKRKAEKKALALLETLIGTQQCDVYRRHHRVILKPNKHFWVIGNLHGSYHKDFPFMSKPDVWRVDNPKKNHITSFCVDQKGGGPTPYTDKVIAFATHLLNDEKAFYKLANRISENTLDDMPACARWGV